VQRSRLQEQETAISPERLERFGISPEEWQSVFAIVKRRPLDCARIVLTRMQFILLTGLLLLTGMWVIFRPVLTLTILNGILITFYLVLIAYKFYLIHLSLGAPRDLRFSEAEIQALRDDELPRYTILVPLYDETECLPRLIRGLSDIDYPKNKLQALLLLEENDAQTIAAVRAADLPDFVSPVITPHCLPKTKPKACNLGLAKATGEYLVVYDAEDRPDPDQLKKAVLGFREVEPHVVCLQARLNFFNQRQNLLTRLFTLEYSGWFDLFLPGMSDMRAPIPLGGTSNHFRVDRLRELMGWDPYNVTEDCDLGMRLARDGYETRMLGSTTWEEACSDLGFWIRQRSRWTKGYIQSYLVTLRHPFRLTRKVGFGRALGFTLMVAGTPLCLLINPLYWGLTLLWFIFRLQGMDIFFPFPIILWGLVCLFAGNFVFIYATLLAAFRRGYFDLVKYGLLVPFYWLLMSVGAWKGFIQIITRPNYWEKTRHGLDIEAGYKEDTAVAKDNKNEALAP